MGRKPEPPTDWYALGVVLYEVLTGAPPWSGPTLARRLTHAAPDPREGRPWIPADLAELCLGLLARAPERRPDADQVLARLSAGGPSRAARVDASSTVFVGRAPLLAALGGAWDRVVGGPVVVFLRGASGIGKSALAQRFTAGLPRGRTVLHGRCYRTGPGPNAPAI